MFRFSFSCLLLCLVFASIGGASAEKSDDKGADVLEGTLRIHPKFHYRYYIDGFGSGQNCALLGADETLRDIKPGTLIRVRGDLASKFFGDRNDKTAALVSTWIVYMDVDQVEKPAR